MKKGLIEKTLKDPNIKAAKYVSYMLQKEKNRVINLCEYIGPDLFGFISAQSPLIQRVDFFIKSFEALISLHKAVTL